MRGHEVRSYATRANVVKEVQDENGRGVSRGWDVTNQGSAHDVSSRSKTSEDLSPRRTVPTMTWLRRAKALLRSCLINEGFETLSVGVWVSSLPSQDQQHRCDGLRRVKDHETSLARLTARAYDQLGRAECVRAPASGIVSIEVLKDCVRKV